MSVAIFLTLPVVTLLSFILIRYLFSRSRNKSVQQFKQQNGTSKIVGILHPYSNGGGGGERVLWWVIKTIQAMDSNIQVVLYTGDDMKDYEKHVKKVFNIELDRPIHIVRIRTRFLVELPVKLKIPLTLLAQSLATMIVGLEALVCLTPDIFIDTYGAAFTFLGAKVLAGCKVATYTHYPTISTDMLEKVKQGTTAFNNSSTVAKNSFLRNLKQYYYHGFAYLYGFMGRFADVVMVNSTWTYNHIHSLWPSKKIPKKTSNNGDNIDIVYPPVAVTDFNKIKVASAARELIILSIGQFRPEKDHTLQLEAFAILLKKYEKIPEGLKLVLLGGVRDKGDEQRVKNLEILAEKLGIQDRVEFMKGASFTQLMEVSSRALIGLHTMWNEHFGICIVEYMAAALIPLAHRSGGPMMDIVDESINGFLAATKTEYAEKMYQIIEMDLETRERFQVNARRKAEKFSDENFEESARNSLKYIINSI